MGQAKEYGNANWHMEHKEFVKAGLTNDVFERTIQI
jgi:hypothetical protein